MPDVGPTTVLPRRPLTVGELLDSAVLLLRAQGRVLIPLGVLLAAGEQLLLYPLRRLADALPPVWWSDNGVFPLWWQLLAVGAATEAVLVLLLGNPAARAAGAALLGRRATVAELLRPAGARWGVTLLLAPAVGLLMLTAALLGPAWLVGYGLLGSVAAAVVLDRVPGVSAVPRAARVAVRGRAAAVRLLGYLGWWVLRVGLALGLFFGVESLHLVDLADPDLRVAAAMLAFGTVNSVAYPALACLDAVIHLDTRMRTEGLDIQLARTPAGLVAAGLPAVER
ncbi:hypothetical protein TPA0907_43910 [Micromonospora humidisoli]|uniref:Glycerophosphoryl diester phosphodiesterase membrane domain-containing protein n=1 Tax=Micromonospora humidisoli TaxID=2807622 RepID=A0ABS2J3M7_9ACTN|nr:MULTISPECIES: hypothetical protein [Micromonospora]MBM7081167.1 hypothetical protein [Micromonospora humidisoli]GHJ10024.1 hypothetical protein TPA0907_43910 [Micromonospora sp. AKA109]